MLIKKIKAFEIIIGHEIDSKNPYPINNKQAIEFIALRQKIFFIVKEINNTKVAEQPNKSIKDKSAKKIIYVVLFRFLSTSFKNIFLNLRLLGVTSTYSSF